MRTIARSLERRGGVTRGGRRMLAASACVWLATALPGCMPDKGTIGAVIAQDEQSGRLFLRDVPPGLAAARAELKPGDEILLIDGLDVRFMDPKQIHSALVGEVDTPVKLTLIRDEQVLRVTLKRTQARRMPRKSARGTDPAP